jgi:predicted peptidase
MKRNVLVVMGDLCAAIAACAVLFSCHGAVKASYTAVVEGYDWGPAVSRIVIDFGEPVLASSVDRSLFSVQAERRDRVTKLAVGAKGDRPVIDAFLSDREGNRISADSGDCVALLLKVGPDEILSSPFVYDLSTYLNRYVDVNHVISMSGSLAGVDGSRVRVSLGAADSGPAITLVADDFDVKGVSDFVDPDYGNITLRYASFSPKDVPSGAGRRPLIIWLHGAGEGGTDPYIALLGNRVTALASPSVQGVFGGAFVLVPQTPLVWMHNGLRAYPPDGSTRYTKALKHLIDEYIAATPGVDPKRVYVGGCSNGGFMTVKMILAYPDFFAAAWPVCEAYADRWISDAEIEAIKNVPIWFTQAKSDSTVRAAQGGFSIDTYHRLIAAGAKNVHLSLWDRVVDLSGRWKKTDGSAYEYNGHFSWIYALNDQCSNDFDGNPVTMNGKPVFLMEWLAAQSK